MTRRTALLFLASLGLLVSREARADLVDPGEKRVDYTFELENASSFPEYVFLAHPYTTSFGAPMPELGVLGGLPLMVGKYVQPVVYAMKRSDFEASSLRKLEGAALEMFFAEGKGLVSSGLTIRPQHFVPDRWPVKGIHDVVRVEKLEAGVFVARLAKVVYSMDDGKSVTVDYPADGKRPDPPGVASAPARSEPAEPPPTSATADPAETTPVAPAHAPSGCGGCAVKGEEGAAGFVFLLGVFAAFRARRRGGSMAP
ncbi:MYXO-CTERM sorting domain-containing protein [Polyangium sp. 15x6]|uniref:MYXO-CTERM sorting domain-containing protein n=1 Tax=Polyangium sp. 15x6 TaxID=3042687 RepID=UPI00249A32C9|nr:MYXO-CTERM sorting domain-containing protein [Polyangium sp. 15x6]MDI3286124.1 MYXO-CTERM sorting domain-containing protein [Polyangium sp. 15x6]